MTAEREGISPQDVVNRFHAVNTKRSLTSDAHGLNTLTEEALSTVERCSTNHRCGSR